MARLIHDRGRRRRDGAHYERAVTALFKIYEFCSQRGGEMVILVGFERAKEIK